MHRQQTFASKVIAAAASVCLSAIFLATAIAPAIPAAGGGTLA